MQKSGLDDEFTLVKYWLSKPNIIFEIILRTFGKCYKYFQRLTWSIKLSHFKKQLANEIVKIESNIVGSPTCRHLNLHLYWWHAELTLFVLHIYTERWQNVRNNAAMCACGCASVGACVCMTQCVETAQECRTFVYWQILG